MYGGHARGGACVRACHPPGVGGGYERRGGRAGGGVFIQLCVGWVFGRTSHSSRADCGAVYLYKEGKFFGFDQRGGVGGVLEGEKVERVDNVNK